MSAIPNPALTAEPSRATLKTAAGSATLSRMNPKLCLGEMSDGLFFLF